MKYRQCELLDGESELVCWLPEDPRVIKGASVELKELPGVIWTVVRVGTLPLDHDAIHRKWRVGGLV